MENILINSKLKQAAPNLHLGVIYATVEITKHDDGLWEEIDNLIDKLKSTVSLEESLHLPQIEALRLAYKSLGKDPSRYRSSAEALLRRILKGQELYQINTIVDINNLISLETMHSVGSYDLNNLKTSLEFRVGEAEESYKGIGKEMINISELPVFSDEDRPFGSPTSDSERAMITLDTTKVMMVIISFSGQDNLEQSIQRAEELLKLYSTAVDVETTIVS